LHKEICDTQQKFDKTIFCAHISIVLQVSLHVLEGSRLVYSLPLSNPVCQPRLALKKAPEQMRLTGGGHLEWLAELSRDQQEENIVVVVEGRIDDCSEPEELVIRIRVEKCGCLNGGWCVQATAAESTAAGVAKDGDKHPACECSEGFSGELTFMAFVHALRACPCKLSLPFSLYVWFSRDKQKGMAGLPRENATHLCAPRNT